MANISTYLADKLLDHTTGKTSYTMPTVYVGLFTTNPTMPAGTGGTEVTSTGGYARVALGTSTANPFGAAASGSTSNSNTSGTNGGVITFPTATANWSGPVTGVGLFDGSSTGANLLAAGALTTNETVNDGDTFSFALSNLTLTLS